MAAVRIRLSCRGLLTSVGVLVLAACGGSAGGGSTSSPTSPSASNVSPVIAAMTVSPSSGVSALSSFTLTASATDANGDSLTYTWTAGTATITGATQSTVISGDGPVTVRLTVTDGKGGSATDTRTVTIKTLTGTWNVVGLQCDSRPFTLTLTQSGGIATGSFRFPVAWCAVPANSSGVTDPAEPAIINAAGHVDIRLKVAPFIDFYLRGDMSADGRTITGGMFNSGFTGHPFTMTKQ